MSEIAWRAKVYRECCEAFPQRGIYGIGVRLCNARGDLVRTIDVDQAVWMALGTEEKRRAHIEELVGADSTMGEP